MLLGMVLLSVACFFAIMIGTWSGMSQEDFAGGAWPAVSVVPLIGLPLAMILLVVLIVMNARRRSRAAEGDGRA